MLNPHSKNEISLYENPSKKINFNSFNYFYSKYNIV